MTLEEIEKVKIELEMVREKLKDKRYRSIVATPQTWEYLLSRCKNFDEGIREHRKSRELRPKWHQTRADDILYELLEEE